MPQKILLADDSVTVQRVIELTFQDEGMQVLAVGDGRQAIERVLQERPDIVLADVSMPERDGYEVAAFVKGHAELAHIPVVLMTGAFEQIDETRARAVGCDATLAKPFEPHMVIALVRQLLGENPAEVPSAAATAGPPDAATSHAAGFPFDAAPPQPTPPSLDEYFDRLDEALERNDLTEAPSVVPPAASAGAARVAAAVGSRAGAATAAPPATVTLADAFSVLLAEELGEQPLPAAWRGLAGTAGSPANAGMATEAFVDEVARRVVERMSDRLVREIVTARVVDVAERLVREEIERIKAST